MIWLLADLALFLTVASVVGAVLLVASLATGIPAFPAERWRQFKRWRAKVRKDWKRKA